MPANSESITIHWVSPHPTFYNNHLHSALARHPTVDLTVHYLESVKATHPWRTPLPIPFQHARAGWRLFRLALHSNATFIVAGWRDPSCIAVLLARGLTGLPFVIWTDTPADSRRRGVIKTAVRRAWLAWLFQRAQTVMATGKPGVAALRTMGCRDDKIANLPFFVDLDYYARPAHLSSSPTTFKFLSVGRLDATKGHLIALRALHQLRSEFGIDNWEYFLGGAGPSGDEIVSLTKQLDLERHVHMLGWLEPSEVREWYHRCEGLIHPSLSDPFPVTVLEAMASEMVVFGSDACGSVTDRITHARNGFIHKSGDVQHLAQHLAEVVTTPSLAAAVACEARKTAMEWPVERGIEGLLKTFRRIGQPSS